MIVDIINFLVALMVLAIGLSYVPWRKLWPLLPSWGWSFICLVVSIVSTAWVSATPLGWGSAHFIPWGFMQLVGMVGGLGTAIITYIFVIKDVYEKE